MTPSVSKDGNYVPRVIFDQKTQTFKKIIMLNYYNEHDIRQIYHYAMYTTLGSIY